MNVVVTMIVGLGLVLSPWLAASARAGAPLDQLKAQIERVLRIMEDPEMKKGSQSRERRVAVRKVADEIFDFQETAKRSLARHWQPRTPTLHV